MMNNFTRDMLTKSLVYASALVAIASISACRVNVNKASNGEQKSVQVDTPFGGVHVNTDQTTAADLGLTIYPGAQVINDDNHKSADVHLGFGQWELRVRTVSYSTPDSQNKVVDFYRQALSRYGTVITCKDGEAVGSPAVTSEGLNCEDDKHVAVNVKVDSTSTDPGMNKLELKAGSKRHQHIVTFSDATAGPTRFSLVALDLPAGSGSSGSSD